jgi:hypothetical protein
MSCLQRLEDSLACSTRYCSPGLERYLKKIGENARITSLGDLPFCVTFIFHFSYRRHFLL